MGKSQKIEGAVAQFDNPSTLIKAAVKMRDEGFKRWDTHSPFPVHGMDDAMGTPRTKLGWLVAVCALCGTTGAYILQWWMSSQWYPIVISGKPLNSYQAWVPVMFELSILAAAFTTVFGMLAFNMLPRYNHPVFNSDNFVARHMDDGFFVSVEAYDQKFDKEKTLEFLESIGGSNIELLISNE
jgi:hypothetical protein